MKLRVMTYNVRGLKDDLGSLRRVVGGVQPDILFLQEVPRHPFSDHRVAGFAGSLGMLWGGGARHRMSTTLFTSARVHVRTSGHGLYTVPRPQEPRGYGWAQVGVGNSAEVVVVSTHLTLYDSLRPGHLEELFADPTMNHDLPWIVGGDFNERPDGPASPVVNRRLRDVGSREFTSPAREPVKRIDFIYASPTLTAAPCEIPASTSDLERATDHRPVAVDIELPQ